MVEQLEHPDALLSPSDEYIFGSAATRVFDHEGNDSEAGQKIVHQVQLTAAHWLTSNDPYIQEQRAHTVHSFAMKGMEVPPEIGPDGEIRSDIVRWLANAHPDNACAFMAWNVAEQEVLQEDLDRRIPDMQNAVLHAVSRLAVVNALPNSIPAAYTDAISETRKIQALDPIVSAEYHCTGLYNFKRKLMGIAGSLAYVIDDDDILNAVGIHEYGHATEVIGCDALRSMGIVADPLWAVEVIPEHIKQSSLYGGFNQLSPADRKPGEDGSYLENRLAFSALLQFGKEFINARIPVIDYFSQKDITSPYNHTRELINRSYDQWYSSSFSVIDRISIDHAHADTGKDRAGVLCYWYDKLAEQTGHRGLSAKAIVNRRPSSERTIPAIRLGEYVSGSISTESPMILKLS